MAHQFCDHLDEYGAQFTRTEASYHQCMNLLERIMEVGPSRDMVDLVTRALAEWSTEVEKLREMLVEAVREGRVRVPSGIVHRAGGAHRSGVLAIKRRRVARNSGHPVCTECRFAVPRLEYPDWQFAHNGSPSFRGVELPVFTPVAEPEAELV